MDRHNLWLNIDLYKRKSYLNYEIKKLLLSSIRNSKKYSYLQRYKTLFYLSLVPRISSKTQANNRCVFSGRNKGVSRKTNYSRFYSRNEIYEGNIPGFKRSSW